MLFLVAVILFFIFIYWAHQPSNKHDSFIFGKDDYKSNDYSLTVLTYNIAYGRGHLDDKGNLKSRDQIISNLDAISKIISESNADIAFLQEVDFDSHRTHNIDQAKYIFEKTNFKYCACTTTWVKNYIPYPLWPPSQHYKKMRSGQCILSKYPISKNIRHDLPMIENKPYLYKLFYLNRAVQEVDIEINNQVVKLINVHLEAFDHQNKLEQAKILAGIANSFHNEKTIIAGDFNALSPNASLKNNFPDKPPKPWDDVSNDNTMETFFSMTPGFKEALTDTDENETFTFPAHMPSRKIDYLFYKGFRYVRANVMQGGLISDHLPIVLKLEIQ